MLNHPAVLWVLPLEPEGITFVVRLVAPEKLVHHGAPLRRDRKVVPKTTKDHGDIVNNTPTVRVEEHG